MNLYKVTLRFSCNYQREFSFLVVDDDITNAQILAENTFRKYDYGSFRFHSIELLASEGQYASPNILLLEKQLEGDKQMSCPKCKAELECPCVNCAKNFPEKKDTPKWEWIDGELCKCPLCGFTAHADVWESREYDEYVKLNLIIPTERQD